MGVLGGSAGRKILSYELGREAGAAWAIVPGRSRALEVMALRRFFAGVPSSLEWVRLEPWPGWTHWSVIAVVTSGLDVEDDMDLEEPESRLGVEEAIRDLSRSVGDVSEGRDLDPWFIAGFVEAARRG